MQGTVIPFPFGYAWHDWDRDALLFIWIPFNKLFAWWKQFELWIRFGRWDDVVQQAYRAGYNKGRDDYDRREAEWSRFVKANKP
ncbi:MAG TPA: hypothetical protein VF944_07395 [Candidatus Bathyarchaeia archaeon]